MKNVIEHLQERGFIDQMSSEDLKQLLEKPISAYVGFDPTADSLHLGNLVGIIALEWMQRFGHTPYVVLGGATGRIGDPSGKSQERPLLSEELLSSNLKSLAHFFKDIFSDAKNRHLIVNNDSWYSSFTLIHFLRDVGKEFRLSTMLAKESVKARLQSEEGMSFTEFSYQILQAYDFFHLFQKEGVVLQMGGSDQWGNITAGIELTRRLAGKTVYGFTHPLLTRSDGKKFGKSEEGAIWLSAHKLSPYQFYQYLVRVPDADVIKLMRMLTFMEMAEIRQYEKMMQEPDYIPNTAQKKFAEEVTRFVHKEKGLELALKVTEGVNPGSSSSALSSEVLSEIAEGMPRFACTRKEIIGEKFTEIASKSGLVSSKAEAVRLIKNGGAYLNNQKVEDVGLCFQKDSLIDGKYILIAAGKRKKILLCISD